MAYHFSGNSLSGFGKGIVAPAPAPPPTPTAAVPGSTADYIQDPACPEGQKMTACEGADCDPGEMECDEDPVYISLMEKLNAELRALDSQEKEAAQTVGIEEKKAAQTATLEADRERLRIEMEQQRILQDEQRRIAKIEEEENIKKLVIFGIGGLGVLTVVTLLIKLIFR